MTTDTRYEAMRLAVIISHAERPADVEHVELETHPCGQTSYLTAQHRGDRLRATDTGWFVF